MKLKDCGWVWEGQGLDPGVAPSIFGVGEGCKYFGLSRACYMFHPNNELAMSKLSELDEVICDISKWKFRDTPDGGFDPWIDASPESVKKEAALVSRLSGEFPNITGGFHDDMLGLVKRENFTPEQYAEIYQALKSCNANLKLWVVVYTNELKPEDWADFLPYIDIINLWERDPNNLAHLDERIAQCREMFPDKPLIIGCYLRDYLTAAPVPMELLKVQWECLLQHIEQGTVEGYSILGAVLIDGQQEQANWVRDFIAANS